jgi:RES domain
LLLLIIIKYRLTYLSTRSLSLVNTDRDIRLADLTGSGLTYISADARLTTGSYGIAQKWALALWKHPDLIDGLYYRSRYDPSRFCIVLFSDRFAHDNLIEKAINQNFLDPLFINQLTEILDKYDYGISS